MYTYVYAGTLIAYGSKISHELYKVIRFKEKEIRKIERNTEKKLREDYPEIFNRMLKDEEISTESEIEYEKESRAKVKKMYKENYSETEENDDKENDQEETDNKKNYEDNNRALDANTNDDEYNKAEENDEITGSEAEKTIDEEITKETTEYEAYNENIENTNAKETQNNIDEKLEKSQPERISHDKYIVKKNMHHQPENTRQSQSNKRHENSQNRYHLRAKNQNQNLSQKNRKPKIIKSQFKENNDKSPKKLRSGNTYVLTKKENLKILKEIEDEMKENELTETKQLTKGKRNTRIKALIPKAGQIVKTNLAELDCFCQLPEGKTIYAQGDIYGKVKVFPHLSISNHNFEKLTQLKIIDKIIGKNTFKVIICNQANDLLTALDEQQETQRYIITHEDIDSQRLKDEDIIVIMSGKQCQYHAFPKNSLKFMAFNFLTPEDNAKDKISYELEKEAVTEILDVKMVICTSERRPLLGEIKLHIPHEMTFHLTKLADIIHTILNGLKTSQLQTVEIVKTSKVMPKKLKLYTHIVLQLIRKADMNLYLRSCDEKTMHKLKNNFIRGCSCEHCTLEDDRYSNYSKLQEQTKYLGINKPKKYQSPYGHVNMLQTSGQENISPIEEETQWTSDPRRK